MKPVTLWYRFENNKWSFNHIEDGHCLNDQPTPKCDAHKKSWMGGKWKRTHAFLNDMNVVVKENEQGTTAS